MIALGLLDLFGPEATSSARRKILRLAEGLGLGPIRAARMAAVVSEVARRLAGGPPPATLAVHADVTARMPQLRLDFRLPRVETNVPLLDAFFDRVDAREPGLVQCWALMPSRDTFQGGALERLRTALGERSRAELLADLARQNKALEQHRAQLETTVERRTAELQAATDRAEKANLAKSEFLSHMSHELRTPLNGVLGHSQILLRSGDVTPGQRKSLSAIDSSGRHLLTLINDILDLSKIEAGELELEEGACDIPSLVLDVCNIIRPRADKKGVVVRQDIEPDVPRAVLTDPTKLRQCLVNVAGNAAKFTDEGSVTLRVCLSGGYLQFEVVDTGVGISQEDLALLFQPFRQAQAGRSAGGTGLGLAISRRLMDRLGGELQVDSRVGHGTVFRLSLPSRPVAGTGLAIDSGTLGCQPQAQVRVLAPGQSCSVLVVDDNETNRDVLVSMLQPAGFEVEVATDGLVALERMRARPFDLVLMDLRMPRMTGEEALREIRRDPGLASTQVMAVTASLETGLMSQLESLGFDDALSKPFLVGTLFEKMKALTGIRWAEPEPHGPGASAATPAEAFPGGAALSPALAQEVLPELDQALLEGDLPRVEALGTALQARPQPSLVQLGEILCDRCAEFDMPALEAIGERLRRHAS